MSPVSIDERAPYVESLHVGMTGRHVAAYQRMLHRWNAEVRPNWASPSEEDAYFGTPMREQVRIFQRAWSRHHPSARRIPANGHIGPRTHKALVRHSDGRACLLLRKERQAQKEGVAARKIVVKAALKAYRDHQGKMIYSGPNTPQSVMAKRWEGIQKGIELPRVPKHADCSSLATWCLWNAREEGATDPSDPDDQSWSWGTTFSMEPNGKKVSVAEARPGDLVFYEGHVTVIVERSQGIPYVVSFGSQGGPYYERYNYRNDVTSVKDYIS